ncbi:MAG: hypothetical protein K1000chlam2_01129 [Chlamydiae bacterium]|nr:hypothetical protein [Chlamydiota bacterium]
MSSNAIGTQDLSEVYHAYEDILQKYLPESSQRAYRIIESSALLQITYASLKNAPYALAGKQLGIYDLCHVLSSRVTFIEATLMALACVVHNVFFTLVYFGLSVGTLGFSEHFVYCFSKHLNHTIDGFCACGIGILGVVTPYYGVGLNVGLLMTKMKEFLKVYRDHDIYKFETDLLSSIRDFVDKYQIYAYKLCHATHKEHQYQTEIKPSLDYIKKKIHTAGTVDDLFNLLIEIRDRWPKLYEIPISVSKNSPAARPHYV